VKNELRALNLGNQERKWSDREAPSEGVIQKKPTVRSTKSPITGS